MRANLIALVDAAYDLDASDDAWIEGVFRAAAPALDRGRGMYAFSYDASFPGKFSIGPILERNVARPVTDTEFGRAAMSHVDPGFVHDTYLTQTCALASERPEFDSLAKILLTPHRIADVLVINCRDAGGKGWNLGSYLPRRISLSGRERLAWNQVAAHVAAASRLRSRAREFEDARLDLKGQLDDGDILAKRSREALRGAVLAYERAHATGSRDPEGALENWRVLVDARWSLVDGFERDGTRYIVARRNDSDSRGPKALTTRERQVLSLAALGQSNKFIAYELGISHATVRVLVARAAAKLGATSRAALVRIYMERRG
jgi:DNA-binding CsgD family transcriptional regulator